ncbi:hypothetical protein TNCV_3313841 [Trichonephila clavipes]|nr:hypothetical protein TNCV_3313841 [Trichonephila clavipes]
MVLDYSRCSISTRGSSTKTRGSSSKTRGSSSKLVEAPPKLVETHQNSWKLHKTRGSSQNSWKLHKTREKLHQNSHEAPPALAEAHHTRGGSAALAEAPPTSVESSHTFHCWMKRQRNRASSCLLDVLLS